MAKKGPPIRPPAKAKASSKVIHRDSETGRIVARAKKVGATKAKKRK